MKSEYGLFKVSERLLAVMSAIEEAEGELTPELEAALDITREDLDNTVVDFVLTQNVWESQSQFLSEKMQELTKMKEVLDNRVKRIDQALMSALLNFGEQDRPTKSQKEKGWDGTRRLTIKTEDHFIKLSNTRREVLFLNSDFNAENYPEFNEVTIRVPMSELKETKASLDAKGIPYKESTSFYTSKTAIKEAIESGQEVKGATVEIKHYLKKSGV